MRRIGLSVLGVVSAILVAASSLQVLQGGSGRITVTGKVMSTEEATACWGSVPCGDAEEQAGNACRPDDVYNPCRCVLLIAPLYGCQNDEYEITPHDACPLRHQYSIHGDCVYLTHYITVDKNCNELSYKKWECDDPYTNCGVGQGDPELCKEYWFNDGICSYTYPICSNKAANSPTNNVLDTFVNAIPTDTGNDPPGRSAIF